MIQRVITRTMQQGKKALTRVLAIASVFGMVLMGALGFTATTGISAAKAHGTHRGWRRGHKHVKVCKGRGRGRSRRGRGRRCFYKKVYRNRGRSRGRGRNRGRGGPKVILQF